MSPSPWDCPLCRRSRADVLDGKKCAGIEDLPECPRGRTYRISEENEEFRFLFDRMAPALCRPDGSFDYSAIANVFEIYGITGKAREFMFDKCLIMIGLIREVREKNRSDGR